MVMATCEGWSGNRLGRPGPKGPRVWYQTRVMRRLTAAALSFGALSLGWALSACPRTVPFDGTVYRDEQVAYRVGDIPPAWRRIEVTNANLAFRDERDEASVL